MPDSTHVRLSTTSAAEEQMRNINSELWHACAGPLVSLPLVGSHCVYLPQGHSEQVAASTQQDVDANIPNYHPNLRPHLVCQLHDVILHADLETDEVYCQMVLQPVNLERGPSLAPDMDTQSRHPNIFFCKMLTASDTSTHGGFSIPRRAAERVFPPLDFSMQPPAQEIVARDLHDTEWKFRHIYRGQPKRHLLTTGWSVFVSAKRLMAGDSIIFIRNEKNDIHLGTRRATRSQTFIPSSVLSSGSMHIGVLAAAAHAASTNSRFTVFYNPRASPSEFVIPLSKFEKAVYHTRVSVGMRFRMLFETEDSSVRRYMGTVTHIGDLDPVRWANSQWRSIKVGWDESTAGERPKRVSIWEIEPLTTFLVYPPSSNWRLRPSWPQPIDMELEGSKTSAVWSQFQHDNTTYNNLTFQNTAINPSMSSMQHPYNPTVGSIVCDTNRATANQENFPSNQLHVQQHTMQRDQIQFKAHIQPMRFLNPQLSSFQDQKTNGFYLQPSGNLPPEEQKGYVSLHQQHTHSTPFDQLHQQHAFQSTNEASIDNISTPQPITMDSRASISSFSACLSSFPRANHSTLTPESKPPYSNLISSVRPGVPISNIESTIHHTANILAPWLPPAVTHLPSGSQPQLTSTTEGMPAISKTDGIMLPNYSAHGPSTSIGFTNLCYEQDNIPSDLQKPFPYRETNQNHLSNVTEMEYKAANENEELHSQYPEQDQTMEDANLPTRTYTKVYKTGSVGRSLDLTRFNDYGELRYELEKLFGLDGQLKDPGSEWKLVFLDKENDWLLLGDDPWEVFINSVRSLKIMSPLEFLYEVFSQQQQQRSSTSGDGTRQQDYVVSSASSFDF